MTDATAPRTPRDDDDATTPAPTSAAPTTPDEPTATASGPAFVEPTTAPASSRDAAEPEPLIEPSTPPVPASEHANVSRTADVTPADAPSAADPDADAPAHADHGADRRDADDDADRASRNAEDEPPAAGPVGPFETDPVPPAVPVGSVAAGSVAAGSVAAGTAAAGSSAAASHAPSPSPSTSAAGAQPQVVYVQTPVPPKRRGNRGFGVLMALVATIVLAVAYLGIGLAIISGVQADTDAVRFASSPIFWVPVVIFLVAATLAALLVNRAGWWAHVLVSLVVALVVYAGTVVVALLSSDLTTLTAGEALVAIAGYARDPLVIVAAVLAREVAIWTGLGVAARGRRVTARNVEAREAFDREQAQRREEHARASAA